MTENGTETNIPFEIEVSFSATHGEDLKVLVYVGNCETAVLSCTFKQLIEKLNDTCYFSEKDKARWRRKIKRSMKKAIKQLENK